jgi:2,4-dienoyl-CoA reductase-like NADH-dependent reductase (Old Yellow Enzyme family)
MSAHEPTAIADLEHVWQPLTIGPTEVAHRIMYTAQTILYAEDHILSDRHIAFYRERAMGGAALLVTEQQAGHRLSKGSFHMGCTAWEKRAIPQYAKLADAVHEFGAKQFVQLFACGVHDKGTMIFDEWHPLWAASRVVSYVHREVPLEMEREHIRDVCRGYGESALNVKVAGLDGVEIHGAHSYLVGQFLSRAYNKRTDEYGGSVANRCRFPIEIAEAIRAQVGDTITVGMRMTFDEFMGTAGITPEETEEALDVLAATGLYDYFSISGGGYHTLHMAVAPMSVPEGFMIPFGKRAKAVVGDRARIFVVGRILDVRMADAAVADGAADMVAMTRGQMADPFLVTKAREGREDEIVRCVGANYCLSRAFDQREVGCVMNPATGREARWGHGTLRAVNGGAKRVVVVGGGPAGMKTAAVAARRGHHVVLLEHSGELGGHLNLVKRLPTRAAWHTAILNLSRPLERAGVDVRLGHEATLDVLRTGTPDVVVVATGSHWDERGLSAFRPDREEIPGWEQDNVLDVASATQRALDDPKALGERVLVFDESAGYLPLGLADVLSAAGVAVEVISPQLFLGEDTLKTMDLQFLVPRLLERGVRLTAQHGVERIDGNVATVHGIWGTAPEEREFDTLVISTIRLPADDLYFQARDEFGEVHRVGDAVAPRSLAAVIYEGEELGRAI